ncbi:hypothetical protein PFLCHA0_c24010 [Pseudomonas protegens CHA0]|uniref:Uncharacterized protein n=1 Tax=Pseudomonas protegens (strain DSM 19095 / LMG 27888 / CFBP 6595 / CHA0) TaxID=1124983 RepID=A0A2C9EKJ1_PSEPH|nr:hypothetical protein PFLCHA0_c24010 [Pseudomonas protegens CHA0]
MTQAARRWRAPLAFFRSRRALPPRHSCERLHPAPSVGVNPWRLRAPFLRSLQPLAQARMAGAT